MKIMGIELTETDAKRLRRSPANGMDVNVNIEDILIEKDLLLVKFSNTFNYRPDVGYVRFYGNVLLKDTQVAMKKMVTYWKKNKRLPKNVVAPIVNLITSTSSVNGVFVTRTINLPSPMVAPTFQQKV